MSPFKTLSIVLSILTVVLASDDDDGRKLINDAAKKVVSQTRLLENGEDGDSCGVLAKCNEGLECIGTPFLKTCRNKECLEQAFNDEFVDKFNLKEYSRMILQEAGLEGKPMYNSTTTSLGSEVFAGDGHLAQYVVLQHANAAMFKAMQANPVPLRAYNAKVANCSKVATVQGTTGFGGGHYEIAVGLKFWNQYYYAQGSNDTSGGIFTDICFGAGPVLMGEITGFGGVAFTGIKGDLVGPGLMFDIGAALGAALGFHFGIHFGPLVFVLEFTVGVGLGAGAAASFCITHQFTETGGTI